MRCSKCGAELSNKAKFCSHCGQKIEILTPPIINETKIPSSPPMGNTKEQKNRNNESKYKKTFADKVKNKGVETWNKLSLYGKSSTISLSVFTFLCLVALAEKKTAPVIIAIVQIVMTIMSILIHKNIIKLKQNKLRLKWIILAIAILLTALNIMSYSWGTKALTTDKKPSSTLPESFSDITKPESNKTESSTINNSSNPVTKIQLSKGAADFKGMNYQDAEKKFREMGFTKFEYKNIDTKTESLDATICYIEITDWLLGDSDFERGDKFSVDSTVTFYSYKYTKSSPVSYSTNDLETAKKVDTGIFSYKSRGGSYDIYWIIDFDNGFVYWFTDGNGDTTCDRIAIDSGTLNNVVTITYHDGNSSWSYGLHFKRQNQPDILIMQDEDGFTYDYYSTNLSKALSIKSTKTICDY